MGGGLNLSAFPATAASTPVVVAAAVVAVVLVALVVVVAILTLRSAGTARRRSRHVVGQAALSARLSHDVHGQLPPDAEDRAMRRRLRRLERNVAPSLSESQRHWFDDNLDGGRYPQALESLARWTVESPLPVPAGARDEFLALADGLGIRGTMLGILHSHDRVPHHALHAEVNGKPGIDIPLAEFEELVSAAIDSLPDEFRKAMSNVVITVEEEAEGRNLFGLYQGVPLTKRYRGTWYANPDQIFIYRKTICQACRTPQEVEDQVHKTVIHEIAHHFGIGDPRLRELGWG